MDNVIYFNSSFKEPDEEILHRLGIRGRRAAELASLGLPIVPGFIIDSEMTKKLPTLNIKETLQQHIQKLEKDTKKKFGDPKKPLMLKVVISSDLRIPFFPSIHNIGLNDETVDGFGTITSPDFAYGEYHYHLKSLASKIFGLPEETIKDIESSLPKKKKQSDYKKVIEAYRKELGENFSDDVYDQLSIILRNAASRYCDSDIDVDNSLSIMVQAMVYGNLGEDSYSGNYYTRDIVSGNAAIDGMFLNNEFDLTGEKGKAIGKIDKKYFKTLTEIGEKVENNFREIREIKFTIEEGTLWLVEQREVDEKSTQAQIKTLLDLVKRDVISEEYIINQIKPNQLNELLHPVIDKRSTKNVKSVKGGIAGSTGAAIGKVYFSTPKLLDEYKKAIMHGDDTNMILVLNSSFAEDVKAIEVARGVITIEGGFSSHAPVVARSLGKVAMVQPEMELKKTSFTLGGKTVKEGDYVSLNVPYYEDPTIYLDKVELIEPDFSSNGLYEFLEIVEKHIGEFNVRANADQPRDAELARSFHAKGIGLCRTEHMFFNEKRIMKFREMIIADDEPERRKALNALLPMQRSDFYGLFKTMKGFPVTIRLLDAPLHEFLPRDDATLSAFVSHMQKKQKGIKKADIVDQIEALHEMNPMLGHRGCRVAITYPEIYEMQCRAIFEAACMLTKEGIEVEPEIMIPIVMSEQEIKFLKNGKEIEGKLVKGIRDIRNEVVEEYGIENLNYKVGTMIELPAAALGAGRIAQHAEFFSFGTNDLTQTTYGLSRDDSGSFFPNYSLYDLMKHNPFKYLGDEVKELIEISAVRGKLTRPDLKLGLCGEHGANPDNIRFCVDAGLDYVSSSPYSIPLAKLGVAQLNLERMAENN